MTDKLATKMDERCRVIYEKAKRRLHKCIKGVCVCVGGGVTIECREGKVKEQQNPHKSTQRASSTRTSGRR